MSLSLLQPSEAYRPLEGEDQLPASFSEGVAAAFRYTRDEGLSVSRGRAWQPYAEARNAAVKELTGEDLIAPAAIDEPWYRDAVRLARSGEIDATGAPVSPQAKILARNVSPQYLRAIGVRENLHRQFPDRVLTDEQIAGKVANDLAGKRSANQAVLARSSGLSQFVGMSAGAVTDPLVLATMPIGLEWQGGKLLANAARAFGSEFVIGSGTEALIQGEVYDFKRSIDSPYTKADALLNVISAGVGAGVLRAVGGAVIDSGLMLRDALRVQGAAKALADAGIDPRLAARIADELETRAASKPPGIDLRVHSDAIDRALDQMDRGRLATTVDPETAARYADERVATGEANDFLNERAAELTATAGNRLSRGERQSLLGEIRNREFDATRAESPERLAELVQAAKDAGVTGKKAKAQAAKAQQAEVAAIRKQVDDLKAKVETDDRYRAAEADLTRLEQARAKDPLKAAERLGWENPTTLRNAVREALTSVGRWQDEGARAFDPFRSDAELKAQRIAEATAKPKVDKGNVPEALRAPQLEELNLTTIKPSEPPPGPAAPAARAEVPEPLPEIPDVKVAVAEREDGSLEVRPVKEIMAEIDDELAALDRLETCLLKEAA